VSMELVIKTARKPTARSPCAVYVPGLHVASSGRLSVQVFTCPESIYVHNSRKIMFELRKCMRLGLCAGPRVVGWYEERGQAHGPPQHQLCHGMFLAEGTDTSRGKSVY
jgi:ferredoxin-like protein FixX